MICCQTVLPDRSYLIGQKLVKSAKIKKSDDLRSNIVTRQFTFNRTKIVQKCQNCKNHRYSIGGLIMITDDVIIGVDLCKMHFLSSNDNRVTIVTLISLCP